MGKRRLTSNKYSVREMNAFFLVWKTLCRRRKVDLLSNLEDAGNGVLETRCSEIGRWTVFGHGRAACAQCLHEQLTADVHP